MYVGWKGSGGGYKITLNCKIRGKINFLQNFQKHIITIRTLRQNEIIFQNLIIMPLWRHTCATIVWFRWKSYVRLNPSYLQRKNRWSLQFFFKVKLKGFTFYNFTTFYVHNLCPDREFCFKISQNFIFR